MADKNIKPATTTCPLCRRQFAYSTGGECPHCKTLNEFLLKERINIISEAKTDAEWLELYKETFDELTPKEVMNCEAQGIDPKTELMNRRFKVIMSMLLETRRNIVK